MTADAQTTRTQGLRRLHVLTAGLGAAAVLGAGTVALVVAPPASADTATNTNTTTSGSTTATAPSTTTQAPVTTSSGS